MPKVIDDELVWIGRRTPLFDEDLHAHEEELSARIRSGRFLLIGGAGSVGHALAREIFRREPAALHVVDVNESALAEVVRDLRSAYGYIHGDFRTFCVDCGDREFESLLRSEGPYDHVLFLATLKHVRSERDPYTLMRLLRVNVLDVVRTLELVRDTGVRKFFSVSTDKASNPINAMGASKSAIEELLPVRAGGVAISKVRLANVAFSNGSLPASFPERLRRRQPITAPRDVRRWFLTETEAAQLCLMSTVFGEDGEIYFPRREHGLGMQTLADIATRYLASRGLKVHECGSEAEARRSVDACARRGEWPCFFTVTDTTGEKIEEEFVAKDAVVDTSRYSSIGILRNRHRAPDPFRAERLDTLILGIHNLLERGRWTREELLDLLGAAVPEFQHHETGRYLDAKM